MVHFLYKVSFPQVTAAVGGHAVYSNSPSAFSLGLQWQWLPMATGRHFSNSH